MQHEAKTSKNGINGISQRLGPPIPLYERPKALIYQAKEPPVAAVARSASCVDGRLDAWTRKFFIKMKDDEYNWRQSSLNRDHDAPD
jgi:hypothetical protein